MMTPTLTTQRLMMRQFCPNDAESFYRNYAEDAENHQYYALPVYSLEKVKDLIEYWAIRQNVGSEVRWAIENRANHEVIGIVALYYNKQHQTGEIRFGIGKEYWGKGLMREALYELFQYCFTILRLKEITAACDLRNKRAISVIKKCGMTYKKTVQEECSGRYYFNIYKKTNSQG